MKRLAILLALTMAGCAPMPVPLTGADPADPSARVPSVRYQPALGRYVSQRPVEPTPWRENNERVTPPSKQ